MLTLLAITLALNTRKINAYNVDYDNQDEYDNELNDLWDDVSIWDDVDTFQINYEEITRKCASESDICLCHNQDQNSFFTCDKQTNNQQSNAYEDYSDYYNEYYTYEDDETDFDQIKSGEGALIWTGFDIQWQNRMKITNAKPHVAIPIGAILGPAVVIADALSKGFMSPHRISKLGSYIDSTNLKAWYTFGPGVDGDYAYPLTKYKSVIVSDKEKISGVEFGEKNLKFSDIAEDDKDTQYPMADTGLIESELIPKPQGTENINSAIILNGFDFKGQCDEDEAKQSTVEKKQKCNSNGIWAYIWDVGIKEVESGEGWKVYVRIARTKNTAKGKAYKPFNYFMDYEMNIFYTIFSGEGLFSAQSELITGQDEMNDAKGTESKFLIPGEKKMENYVVGINKFKFTLSNPEDMGDKYPRGRYFEGLVYGIDDESLHYNDENGQVSGNVYMNVYGSKAAGKFPGATTKKSIVDYEMGLTLLQFADQSVKVGSDEGALGSICQSGNDDPILTPKKTDKTKAYGMDCKAKRIDLPERLRGSVNIERIQLIPEPGTVHCKCFGKAGSMSRRVCGEDGITYANKCIAACYCAKVVHKGKCKSLLMEDIIVKNNRKGAEPPNCPQGFSVGGGSGVQKKRVRKNIGKGRNRQTRAEKIAKRRQRRADRVRKMRERQLRRRSRTLKRREARKQKRQQRRMKRRSKKNKPNGQRRGKKNKPNGNRRIWNQNRNRMKSMNRREARQQRRQQKRQQRMMKRKGRRNRK